MRVEDEDSRRFLNRTFPVQWMVWWVDLPEGPTKDEFKKDLFDGEDLKSLTDPVIRAGIIEKILKEPLMRKPAEQEYDKVVEILAKKILKASRL